MSSSKYKSTSTDVLDESALTELVR